MIRTGVDGPVREFYPLTALLINTQKTGTPPDSLFLIVVISWTPADLLYIFQCPQLYTRANGTAWTAWVPTDTG